MEHETKVELIFFTNGIKVIYCTGSKWFINLNRSHIVITSYGELQVWSSDYELARKPMLEIMITDSQQKDVIKHLEFFLNKP